MEYIVGKVYKITWNSSPTKNPIFCKYLGKSTIIALHQFQNLVKASDSDDDDWDGANIEDIGAIRQWSDNSIRQFLIIEEL